MESRGLGCAETPRIMGVMALNHVFIFALFHCGIDRTKQVAPLRPHPGAGALAHGGGD